MAKRWFEDVKKNGKTLSYHPLREDQVIPQGGDEGCPLVKGWVGGGRIFNGRRRSRGSRCVRPSHAPPHEWQRRRG